MVDNNGLPHPGLDRDEWGTPLNNFLLAQKDQTDTNTAGISQALAGLDLKASLSGATFTGDVQAPNLVRSNTLTVLAPKGDGSTDQTVALQSAMDNAANLGLTLALNGSHVINGILYPASGTKLDGTRGSITQTHDLYPAFRLNSVTGVRLSNVLIHGKTTDWTNSSQVHGASAVYISSTSGGSASSDVQINHCAFLGWAGHGVFVDTGCSDIHIDHMVATGPGATYLTDTTFNQGSGVIVEPGCTNWSITNCDISGFPQGLNTGDAQQDVRISGNYIHDIPSQHGMYIETTNGLSVTANIIRNTGLLGMKIQIGVSTDPEPDTNLIAGNLFINVGDSGISLTNPVGGGLNVRRTILANNIVSTCGADGFSINNAVAVDITGCQVNNAGRHGASITASSEVAVLGLRVTGTQQNGVLLTNVQDFILDTVRVKNPAAADISTGEYGINITTGCSDGTVRNCKVTDANSHMRYAYFVNSTADLTTIGFIDNIGTGATDYGYRGLAVNARTFRGNQFSGGSGAVLTPPSNFTTIPDLTAAPTAADFNALLTVLRANGLIAG